MPLKKTAKRSKMRKLSTKAKNSNHALLWAAKMEKEFRTMPAKIALYYRSELLTVKKQESRLKTELKKAQTQQTTSQKKLTTLAKSKMSPTTRKMMATAKKIKIRAHKSTKDLAGKLTQIHKTMLALDGKQAKFTALGKMLSRLESQIAKKTAKPFRTTKKSGKKVKRSKQMTTSSGTSHEMPPMMSTGNTDDKVEL